MEAFRTKLRFVIRNVFFKTIMNELYVLLFVEFFGLSLPLVSGERKARQITISARFSAWTVGEFFASS